ncbi:MAG TPA: hypothetical protein VM386_04245, partial [Acidimicrobiales bacterium]|nr:hypothetical protein [Acidimicrobiales bacterium]
DRERATKNRAVILNRLAELRDAGEPEEIAESDEMPEPEVAPLMVDAEEEEFFPIEDYDDLTVGEILPLLPELYDDELDVVEDRERATKNRAVILNRLAELRDAAEPEPDAVPAMVDEEEAEWEVPGEGWEDRAPATEDVEAEEDVFPIADYDRLRVSEIRAVLPELSEDELEEVRSAERRGANRITVLAAIDRELGVEVAVPAKKVAPAKKAPAKKAVAVKKAPAKKAGAKRAGPRS